VTAPGSRFTQAQAFAIRMFMASLGAAELMTTYLGLRLGLYDALASGPATTAQLAERAGIAPRYAQEWLEQQATAGIVEVDDAMKAPHERVYVLPPGHADALTQPDSPFSVASLALLPIGGMARLLPDLLEAYRTGGGVPYAQYGPEFRGGQGGLNRAVFCHQLPSWIRTALPDVHARLAAGGARIADIACGAGWSAIALARTYPGAQVDGFDLDEESVTDARRNAADAGVTGRVTFHVRDAADPSLAGTYHLVCIFDALHDLARPVEVLRTCRRLRSHDGTVLLMEPNAAERFTPSGSETERFLFAISVLHCLPVSLAAQPSAATGTAMRPDTVRAYATTAGFTDVHVLPVQHRFHRLYRLLD
jgi:2-polyprenyl-3-methyl-5-hydroxy-6-metoxy-1,4-benzoquinol methylase